MKIRYNVNIHKNCLGVIFYSFLSPIFIFTLTQTNEIQSTKTKTFSEWEQYEPWVFIRCKAMKRVNFFLHSTHISIFKNEYGQNSLWNDIQNLFGIKNRNYRKLLLLTKKTLSALITDYNASINILLLVQNLNKIKKFASIIKIRAQQLKIWS